MAPRTAVNSISFMVYSASEGETYDELNAFPTPDSAAENRAPERNARGKAAKNLMAASVARKSKPAANVLGAKTTGAAVAKKANTKANRKALAERRDMNGSDTEEVNDFESGVEDVAPAPAPKKAAKRGRPAKNARAQQDIEPIEEEAAPVKNTRKAAPKMPPTKKTVTSKKASKAEVEAVTIAETQPDPEHDETEIEQSIEMDDVVSQQAALAPRPSSRRVQPRTRAPTQTSTGVRRPGSASDTERDPILRRKVGDLTKKLEAMTVKYTSLKEAALSSKESNFEQLEKKTQLRAKDQEAVITALKQQVSELMSRSSDLIRARKDITNLEEGMARERAEKEALAKELATARAESKSLSNKLVAARSSAQSESKTNPGSAVKARATGVILPGTAEAAKEAQNQRMIKDLYGDLTNLVMLSVKRNEEGEDVYDCLQTGRNGTLHFHLTVAAGESYEDTEFIYTPLLDEKRDRELIELLPEYLTEEICFPRSHAPKFYSKIVDSMSKNIVFEDD